jgi:hypothetical protein
MIFILLLAVLAQDPAAQIPLVSDVTQLTLSPPKAVAELDVGQLGGAPVRLAWGADGELYVKGAQVDRWGNEKSRHFTLRIDRAAPRANLNAIDAEPAWASSYWLWKSSFVAPGVRDLKLELEVRKELATATGLVRDAGGASQHPRDLSPQVQNVNTATLKLKHEIVAEAVNTTLVSGLSFGWAPAAMGVLAYVDGKTRLKLIGREGRPREVAGCNDALLPAWSPDGKQIAFLQKKDKKTYALMILVVGR